MADIKLKAKGIIKKLDKERVNVQKTKDNIITIKEKINEFATNDDNNTGEEYAGKKVQNTISYFARKGISKFEKDGKKAVTDTKNNFIKSNQKLSNIKTKVENSKSIKGGTKRTIKTSKDVTKITKKEIKTAENTVKNIGKLAKESVKLSKRAFKIAKVTTKLTIKGIKVAIKTTIKAIKALVEATKAIISAIIAGGWIAVIIVVVIVLIAGFVAYIFNTNNDEDYDTSQIANSEIVLVAKAQIGNEGGDKFWKWYGFNEHVQWCACFVSWCANECGYIEKGVIPKFSVCSDGINWFKEKNQWQDRSESYYPVSGDIIFFDWKDENGNQNGISDHVGIVERTDITNRIIYTIEGNADDKCVEKTYSFDDVQVMGYGNLKY